ncbi:MAG: outer membrane protein transport protein [Flavobacteriaceae bacterium]|jgi:hypothetical protein|nr:outer membrane protein transport protein [Flavobacteriaceae bacterium]
MVKKIFLSIGFLLSLQAIAQQGTASPYSFYGIGDRKFQGTNEYKMMGGTSVYSDSIHLNLNNPAALGKLKATTLSVGATSKHYNFKSDDNSGNAKRMMLDYVAVGLPVAKKFGVVFGLQPYSNMGYKLSSSKINDDNMKENLTAEGNGGVNNAFIGIGYEITPNWYVGVEASYIFGHTKNNTLLQLIDNGSGFSSANATNQAIRTDYTGYSTRLSTQYFGKIKNYNWQANVTYKPETTVSTDYSNKTTVVNLLNNTVTNSINTDFSRDIKSPQELTLGTGFGKDLKWFIAGQFTFVQNSKLALPHNSPAYASYEDTKRVNIGGFYIPKYNSFTSYFDRVVYRAGLRYENTGLVLKNESINDYALTAGFGFPVGRNFTNINLGFEYGQRGTTKQNLFKENYFNVVVGISLNDFWFKKRRFE